MALDIEVVAEGERRVVVPHGEIDLVSQSELKHVISDLVVAGHVHLVVDLGETTFLDSTGLGTLIGARRKVHAFHGNLALVCTHDHLLKIFRITSLDKVFAIYPTRAAALASLDRTAGAANGSNGASGGAGSATPDVQLT